MQYELCIEGESGAINITDPDVIKKIDIKVFQSDKSVNDRSDQLFNELTIQGMLDDISQKETKELFDWSMKIDKANVYKTVSIKVYNKEELIRDYYLKEMYCVSYEEIFNEYVSNNNDETGNQPESIGTFILVLKQRKGAINTIKVDC